MKKTIFLAIVAVAAMASCTNSEIIETINEGNAIKFEAFLHKATRATETTIANLGQFTVTAKQASADADYITKQTVSVSTTGVCSDYGTYYWPTDGSTLDFFAWGPSTNTQIVADASNYWNTFTVTPSTTVASQVDFVFARTQGNKADNATAGVAFNFRHAQSQIMVKVKNTNANLKFAVTNWKVVNVASSGTYTNAAASTNGSGKLAASAWSDNDDYTASYTDAGLASGSAKIVSGVASADAVTGFNSMILIPQTVTASADAYETASADAALNGSYIALKMTIMNKENDAVIAAEQWCCWPVKFSWAPGYKYTYVIDLAQGGYNETNNNDGDADLDPVLENSKIIFATVTVDSWTDETEKNVNF